MTIGAVISPTYQTTQVLSGVREAGATVSVTCATATVGVVTYSTATTWQVTVSGLAVGENTIIATSADAAGNQTVASVKIVSGETAPEVTITATPNVLWPPDHKMVSVTLGGGVISHGSDIQTVSISVADEYGKYTYWNLKYGDTVQLEAWRNGNDANGRVYTITAVVTDKAGNTKTKTTTVVVPRDMGTMKEK